MGKEVGPPGCMGVVEVTPLGMVVENPNPGLDGKPFGSRVIGCGCIDGCAGWPIGSCCREGPDIRCVA